MMGVAHRGTGSGVGKHHVPHSKEHSETETALCCKVMRWYEAYAGTMEKPQEISMAGKEPFTSFLGIAYDII